MSTNAERLARTARVWDEAADGYEVYFVPRFAPWVELAVSVVTAPGLVGGPILVPCCGTFPELDVLVEGLGDREIVGIDLSAGMIARARERAAGRAGVAAAVGDASTLDPRWSGRCAAVVSVFGLQQLPDPPQAVGSWLDALGPGGRLSIVFWPQVTETDGPFALAAEVVRAHLSGGDDAAWEDGLAAMLVEHGATLERDDLVAYPMVHADAAAFFDAWTHSGPGRTLAISHGDAFVDMLRTEFLQKAPAGEWRHHPRARFIAAHR